MMSINSETYDFTSENVNKAPDQHGVYELLQDGATIYYGRAAGNGVSIRSRLKSHYEGWEGKCTRAATHYRRAVMMAATAERTEALLLSNYLRLNGVHPRCNDRAA